MPAPTVSAPLSAPALRDLACAVAREAGALLRDGRETVALGTETKTSPTDVVTAMDRAAEALIVRRLLEARPADGVLGEEGAAREGTSGVRWIIDPLDGTVNYLYRLPYWSVCIAAELAGEVVAGAVYDPSRNAMWSAVRGGGALRDVAAIACSKQTELGQALLATGFGYDAARRASQARVLTNVLPAVRDMRRMGSAALDLCATAEGAMDVYYERGLSPWDWAAAGLVAREAGCRVEGLYGKPPSGELVIAAPPALFAALHDRLAAMGADHD